MSIEGHIRSLKKDGWGLVRARGGTAVWASKTFSDGNADLMLHLKRDKSSIDEVVVGWQDKGGGEWRNKEVNKVMSPREVRELFRHSFPSSRGRVTTRPRRSFVIRRRRR